MITVSLLPQSSLSLAVRRCEMGRVYLFMAKKLKQTAPCRFPHRITVIILASKLERLCESTTRLEGDGPAHWRQGYD